MLAKYELSRGQLDGLWSYIGNKGEKNYPETTSSGQFWRSTMIEMDTRLCAARGIDKIETEAAKIVFEKYIKKRKKNDAIFAEGFEGGYNAFKIGVLLRQASEAARLTQEEGTFQIGTKQLTGRNPENEPA